MIPTAEEFLRKNIDYVLGKDCKEDVKNVMIEFAKLHVQEALKEASEKVKLGEFYVFGSTEDEDRFSEVNLNTLRCEVDKDSILNAYNLDNIK